MIPFQFSMFKKVVSGKVDFEEKSLRRKLLRVGFIIGFPLFELWNASMLALDHILFGGFLKEPVDKPLFVIGNPRSGTTFLHRVLALDESNFTTTKAWQLLFPSLIVHYSVWVVSRVDRIVGSPLARLIRFVQDRAMKGADKIHKIRLDVPEEDEGLFIHAFASEFLGIPFPMDGWKHYQHFDELPDEDRKKLMKYYRRCVQRHMYYEGKGLELLSKNPLFCTKVRSVYETFPNARVVYLVRHPAEAICSLHNMISKSWESQGMSVKEGESARHEGLVELAFYYYKHAIESLDQAPQNSYLMIKYEDLVSDPKGTVERIYESFGIELTPKFREVLDKEAEKAKKYKSKHSYSLEQYDLSHEEIEENVKHVYERFGYEFRSRAGGAG